MQTKTENKTGSDNAPSVRDNVGQSAAIYNCQQCRRVMSVIDYIMGPVCMSCCRYNHRKAIGK